MSYECQLARRLLYAFCRIDHFLVKKGKERKMSYAEVGLLYALGSGEPLSQKEIAEEIYFPVTTVNTIVKAWEGQGLIIQIPIKGKRREKQLILTEAGQEYVREHLDFINQAEEKAMKKTLERYSETFIDALEYYGEQICECYSEDQEKTE